MPAWLIPAAIAGGQMLGSWLGNRGQEKQDNQAQQDWRHLWGQAGQTPYSPTFLQSGQTFRDMQNMGMGGMRALGGDPNAVQGLMNPYESQVMDSLDPMYAKAGRMVTNQVNDQATRAGAFGGSRHGVAQGVALGNLAQQQAQQGAQMRYQGFNDAMGRAGQLANFGMGGAQAGAQFGQYSQDRYYNQMLQAMQARPGQSQGPRSDPMSQGVGTFASLFGTGLFK